ncbi:MAG TPA: thioredoxin domain-containing protein [Longimicrobium sp.]|jgi:protein-disulfide isomerase|nr:thioredoxin domain-containing protein [Longimicrobium sp.]
MRTPSWLSAAANVVLIVCAVTVTALVVRQDLFPASRGGQRPHGTERVADWRRYAAQGHRSGPAGAPVDIVVFSDFQCPACRMLAGYLDAIRLEFPDQVAVVRRHAPLPIHQYAVAAAQASECAARQDRFDQFHDALFQAQASIGTAPWSRFAAVAGVPDQPAFDACMAETAPVAALQRDTMDARALKLHSTPTWMVNGVLFRGTPPMDTIRAYVRQAAALAQAPAGPGRGAAATFTSSSRGRH